MTVTLTKEAVGNIDAEVLANVDAYADANN